MPLVLDVFFTVDVEVWCDGWQDIDRKFPDAFRRYIYGPSGEFGLPFQLRVLSDHGLKAVCFVEPLFAARFGIGPLAEIVRLVEEAGHETHLHLHTEWVDEARVALLPRIRGKRQFLHQFDLAEQAQLIAKGAECLQQAGAAKPIAFRAGSFGFNRDTIRALAHNGILVDSSYNGSTFGLSSGVCEGELLDQPKRIDEVLELPMSVFEDGRGLRHVQLTACSWLELEHLLWQGLEFGHRSFVILSHGAELLTPGARAVDPTVVKRFRRLCGFLQRNSGSFRVRGFRNGELPLAPLAPVRRLHSPIWRTALRMAEQGWRRRHAWTR